MPWYRVTKKINGRLYDYWQRTYRVGKSVKTENKYVLEARGVKVHEPSPTAPRTPEDAMWKLNPHHNPDGMDLREYEKQRRKEILDWESVKYGSAKKRTKRHEAKVRAAKRKTRGIKAVNPFLAQGITRKARKPPGPRRPE